MWIAIGLLILLGKLLYEVHQINKYSVQAKLKNRK